MPIQPLGHHRCFFLKSDVSKTSKFLALKKNQILAVCSINI